MTPSNFDLVIDALARVDRKLGKMPSSGFVIRSAMVVFGFCLVAILWMVLP